MASHSMRSNDFQPSKELLPTDYHGLETENELRSHVEQFRVAKDEIVQGKRRRRNSTQDCRTQATIRAAGPDSRFNDIKFEESGLRDGLFAVKFMPSFPNVQDFTRRSARWEDLEQAASSEDDEVQCTSSPDSVSDSDDILPKARRVGKDLKRSSRADSESTTVKTESNARRESAKASTNKGSSTDGIFYKCYATDCKYQHARRGNFSIHWKRDAKHPGTFDLTKVLECSRDQDGKLTAIPYGSVQSHRQRLSFGRVPKVAMEKTPKSASSSEMEDNASTARKRKAPCADSQNSTRTAFNTAPVADEDITQQNADSVFKDHYASVTRPSSARIFSTVECQIFRRLADVPATFPTNLTPLVSHGAPDTEATKTSTSDCRFFCPECEKCFTQTHNVASHFSRHHGKQYSKNYRARTVICRVTTSENGVNIDAKPTDDTVLPRLEQIRQQRTQTASSQQAADTLASNAYSDIQKDVSQNPKSASEADSARSLVTPSQMMHSGQVNISTTSSSRRESSQVYSPRKPSQRVQRMHAIRESILARSQTSPFVAAPRANVQMVDSDTAPNTIEASSTTNLNARNEHERPHTAGIFGMLGLAIPTAGSIAASNRQPEWDAINQPAQEHHGQKRKRTPESDSTAMDEEIACTDDEMDDTQLSQGLETAQKESDAVMDGGDGARRPAKRQKTLVEYLGLAGYSSD